MPSDGEIEKTRQRSQTVDNMWKEVVQKLEQYERDKAEFAREFGVEYEQFVEYMSGQAKQARSAADAEMLAQLEQKSADFKREFDEELAQARARHEAEQQLAKTSGKRSRRMRDMI